MNNMIKVRSTKRIEHNHKECETKILYKFQIDNSIYTVEVEHLKWFVEIDEQIKGILENKDKWIKS